MNNVKYFAVRWMSNTHYVSLLVISVRSESGSARKLGNVLVRLGKVCMLVGLLYLFICSLDLLSSAFRLVGGKAAGKTIRCSFFVYYFFQMS